MLRRFLPALLAVSLATPALADPMVSVTAPNLFANGSAGATITYGPTSRVENVAAGQFNVVATDTLTNMSRTLQVFCTDIFDWLSLPATFRVGLLSDTLGSATKVAQVNALLSNGNPAITTAAQSAGLQLAIWEVVNEAGTTGYDLGTGDFQASNMDGATLAAANADLAHLADNSWQPNPNATVYQLQGRGNQSLSYLDARTEVPEPASLGLLGAALVALGLRRRAARA